MAEREARDAGTLESCRIRNGRNEGSLRQALGREKTREYREG